MEYSLVAPMPGLVARVVVEIGQAVEAEQELCVINCMKTEVSCTTEKAGVVKVILVEEWDEVDVDTPMIVLTTAE